PRRRHLLRGRRLWRHLRRGGGPHGARRPRPGERRRSPRRPQARLAARARRPPLLHHPPSRRLRRLRRPGPGGRVVTQAVPTTAGAPATFVTALKCRECGHEYPKAPVHVCELCFGPLETAYDYDGIKRVLSREVIARRPTSMWRYAELMPLDKKVTVGSQVGWTPLVRADRLA